jgi:hypothetical protein
MTLMGGESDVGGRMPERYMLDGRRETLSQKQIPTFAVLISAAHAFKRLPSPVQHLASSVSG